MSSPAGNVPRNSDFFLPSGFLLAVEPGLDDKTESEAIVNANCSFRFLADLIVYPLLSLVLSQTSIADFYDYLAVFFIISSKFLDSIYFLGFSNAVGNLFFADCVPLLLALGRCSVLLKSLVGFFMFSFDLYSRISRSGLAVSFTYLFRSLFCKS